MSTNIQPGHSQPRQRKSPVVSLVQFSATKRLAAATARRDEIVLVLEELLQYAQRGDLNGVLFSLELRGGRQCAGAVGKLKDDPAALALASLKLRRLVFDRLDELEG